MGALSGFGRPPGGPDRQTDPVGGPPGGTAVVRQAVAGGPPGGPITIKNSPSESSPSKVRPARPRRTTTPTTDDTPAAATADRSRRSSLGTRLPADFQPTAEMIATARREAPLINPATATTAFVDYWTSLPDPKGIRADWDPVWRTWMRNEQIKRENAPGFRGTRVQTAVDAVPARRPDPDEMCPQHQGQLKVTCGPCRGAALGTPTIAADGIPRPAAAMCPEHPDFPAAFCRPCRAQRRTATTPDDRRQP